MRKEIISPSVVKRLPRYYRFLSDLLAKGTGKISSGELSKIMGTTASQIRQDLNCFGGFGQQGYGYNVEILRDEIATILGLNHKYSAVLIGAGNLGRAIANHIAFTEKGFTLSAIFDVDETIIGENMNGIVVENIDKLKDFCKKHKPDVAVLCIPKNVAESMSKQLIEYGINAFWNFSHYDIAMEYPQVSVENVHLGDSLMTLCYKKTLTEEKENN
ncbi:MAG: redox-sensing transcriptional repressor Rex [Oscillospiraceae bacterium]